MIVARRGVAWCGTVWHEVRRGEAGHGQENEERERNCGGIYLTCVVMSGGGKGGSVCVFGGGLAGSAFECGGGMAWVRLRVDVDGGGGGKGGGSKVKGKERMKRESWLGEVVTGRTVMR